MARPKKYDSPDAAYRAKLESNARRQAERLLRIEIQPPKEIGESIKAAAQTAGQSTQGYILDAVRERMAEDSKAGITVCKFKNAALEPHAQAAGQSIKEYIAQAVQERILKDSGE